MIYGHVTAADFLHRDNRFVARVLLNGQPEIVHVKNTGRCKELLIPGTQVYLEQSDNPNRKTRYSLIAVEKNGFGLINMDSQAPNAILYEALETAENSAFADVALRKYLAGLRSGEYSLRREVTYGNSRIDVAIESVSPKGNQIAALLEVKGVTLEEDGIAYFPDAPTERGLKHIRELMNAKASGIDAFIVFIIQMESISCFRPNNRTHAAFGRALEDAKAKGVRILAYDCVVDKDKISLNQPVTVKL
jgi:sugar fermentation stimulation protein A